MSNIKLVKIGGSGKLKSSSIDDILNSSSKIREIIKKKKTLKNMKYLENVDFKIKQDQSFNNIQIVKPPQLDNIQNNSPKVLNDPIPVNNTVINTCPPSQEGKSIVPNKQKKKESRSSKQKNKLHSYGQKLEQTTLSKRRKKHTKQTSNPITSYFNKEQVKQRKTKKYNRNEIKYIINSFKKLYEEKNFTKLNEFISKLNRDQTIQILYACNVVEYKTDAPLPLLKNIVFNIVLGNIRIMR